MDLLTVFKQYGSTPLSYSTLQPDATYFWGNTDTPSGYIAYFYHSFLGKQYISVLGDPISDSQPFASRIPALFRVNISIILDTLDGTVWVCFLSKK